MASTTNHRDRLQKLAAAIIDLQDQGGNAAALIDKFHAEARCSRIDEKFLGDLYPEYIVEYALGIDAARRRVDRDELIRIVGRIVEGRGTEASIHLMVATFEYNCKHPAKSGLIFYPDAYFDGNNNPTVEEIVDMAMSSN